MEVGTVRILLIDDDPAIRSVYSTLLRRAGYEIRVAASALHGLETVREWPPHVVMLDLNMPHVDGIDTLSYLRMEPSTRGAIVIAFSGSLPGGDVVRLRLAGFDGTLAKPTDARLMIAHIERLLSARDDMRADARANPS